MKRILGSVCALALTCGVISAPQAQAAEPQTAAVSVADNGETAGALALSTVVGSSAAFTIGLMIAFSTIPIFIVVNAYHMMVDAGQMQPIPNEQIPAFIR
ncbi:MAG: hypothetical protein Q3972_03090 [Corynebacterium sp.]|nr:hypothetical protein [Corynebacterium sp.]